MFLDHMYHHMLATTTFLADLVFDIVFKSIYLKFLMNKEIWTASQILADQPFLVANYCRASGQLFGDVF